MSFAFSIVSKISTEQLRIQDSCFQIRLISIEKGMINVILVESFYGDNQWNVNYHVKRPFLQVVFNQFFITFRDNGITIQIMSYQVYTELILFLTILIFFLLPIEKNLVVAQIVGILFTFAVFVIHPLFYLNGDVNFRNRVQNQGLWIALKKELFQTNSQIQPMSVSWFKIKR